MSYIRTIRRHSIRLKGHDYSQSGIYFVTICCRRGEKSFAPMGYPFGTIENGEMVLNDVGKMVEKWVVELSHKFANIVVETFIVMPNHFHAIIINNGIDVYDDGDDDGDGETVVGADLRVCPHRNDKIISSGNDKIISSGDDKIISSGNDKIISSGDDKIISSGNDKIISSGNDKIISSGNDKIISSGNDKIISPVWDVFGETNKISGKPDILLGEHAGSPLRAVVQWFKTMTTNEYIRGVKTMGWPPYNKNLWQRNYYEHIIRTPQSRQRITDYIMNNPANWETDKFHE